MHNQENPYIQKIYRPLEQDTPQPLNLQVLEGKIPHDLQGSYYRNGPNPMQEPLGRYHWFDGDGLVHAVHFSSGEAVYNNRLIETWGVKKERQAGKALWHGLMEPDFSNPLGPLKDTANTDIISFGDHLLTSWYRCGMGYQLDPKTLETTGTASFAKTIRGGLSAHPKRDPQRQELRFFNYGPQTPYINYGVLDKRGQLRHFQGIEVPGPRFPHDMAISQNYTVLMDLPVILNEQALQQNRWQMEFARHLPSRFAVIPRLGGEPRWFEATPGYIYHTVNCFEDGNNLIMDACFVPEPIPERLPEVEEGSIERMLQMLQIQAHFRRWVFNLEDGSTKEFQLSAINAEFPCMNDEFLGRRSQFSYHMTLADTPTLLFDGIVKFDTDRAKEEVFGFPSGWYGSEAAFAPRQGSSGAEDEGYLISLVSNDQDQSEVYIFDASRLHAGPLCRLGVPQRVPLGFHACWRSAST